MRGLIAGSLMCLVTLGAMWGTGMGKAMANYTTNAGWIIPVTVQLIPAVIFAVGVPFTVGECSGRLSSGHELATDNGCVCPQSLLVG